MRSDEAPKATEYQLSCRRTVRAADNCKAARPLNFSLQTAISKISEPAPDSQTDKTRIPFTRAQAQPILMAELERLVPGLPTPDDVLTHRWTYSQTDRPYPGQVGAATLVDIPLLVAAGDSFCQASVEGCLISADQAAKIVQSNFNL